MNTWKILDSENVLNQSAIAPNTALAMVTPPNTGRFWNALLVNNTSSRKILVELSTTEQFLVDSKQSLFISPVASQLFPQVTVKNTATEDGETVEPMSVLVKVWQIETETTTTSPVENKLGMGTKNVCDGF